MDIRQRNVKQNVFLCKKAGHIAKFCFKKNKKVRNIQTSNVTEASSSSDGDDPEAPEMIFNVKLEPLYTTLSEDVYEDLCEPASTFVSEDVHEEPCEPASTDVCVDVSGRFHSPLVTPAHLEKYQAPLEWM